MCLRDSQVQFVSARTAWDPSLPSVIEDEALGLHHALQWLINMDVEIVQIELDCKTVVDGLRNRKGNFTELGVVLNKCRTLLQNFPSYQVSFVRRQANIVAHTLAMKLGPLLLLLVSKILNFFFFGFIPTISQGKNDLWTNMCSPKILNIFLLVFRLLLLMKCYEFIPFKKTYAHKKKTLRNKTFC